MSVETLTARLRLSRPTHFDLGELYAIQSDPRVWAHFPSLRHTESSTTARMIDRWERSWVEAGLGSWVVRLRATGELIGNGGCSLLGGELWNLGYRIAADHHGQGYATEVARAGVKRARELAPDRPVVAYLVEHNHSSARVAEKLGLTLVQRGPDAGNPDRSVMRLVYADRPLTAEQLDIAAQ